MFKIGTHAKADSNILSEAKRSLKFKASGLAVELCDYFADDWHVANAIEDREINVAILHTETAVRDIGCFSEHPIVGFFDASHLSWSVISTSNSGLDQCFGSTFASFGPSSAVEINTTLLHKRSNQSFQNIRFENIRNIDELIDSLSENKIASAVLDRERTEIVRKTLPIHESQKFQNQWPGKAIWVRNELVENQAELKKLLAILESIANNNSPVAPDELETLMKLIDQSELADLTNFTVTDVWRQLN